MFRNKKILILGMARSGYAAAKVLSKNNEVTITDMKEQDKKKVKELESLGVKFVLTQNPDYLLDETYDYVIKNPGVSLDHSLLKKAKKLNIPITNEVEVSYSLFPKDIKIIGITGSNGKTTTTTMIYEVLKLFGLPVHLSGNIGYAICGILDVLKPKDILVLELSSHQLHDIINFKTDISVLTNLSEVHLDFFKTYEYYKKQKLRVFNRHTNKDIAILNFEDKDVLSLTSSIPSQKKYFSSKRMTDVYLKDNIIYYNKEEIINVNDIKLKGIHNYENIMAMIAVVKEFNVTNEVIKKYLKDFNGVEHRIEYVREINGIEFYNDSKATNVESTIVALKSFNKDITLLLGGLDRGHTFDKLSLYLKNVKYIIGYGETKNKVKEFASKNNIKYFICDTLEEATHEAYKKTNKESVILLSPACASWDQFKDFEERGREFKKIVKSL